MHNIFDLQVGLGFVKLLYKQRVTWFEECNVHSLSELVCMIYLALMKCDLDRLI